MPMGIRMSGRTKGLRPPLGLAALGVRPLHVFFSSPASVLIIRIVIYDRGGD